MKCTPIEAGKFKLDGGAMFGVVPKRMWNRLNPADEENMCTWSLRSLLVETGDKKILIDTGIGNKQSDKFRSLFYPHGKVLSDSLIRSGVNPEEITDVFITHFHFDHVGGALKKDEHGKIEPTFANAKYWSNQVHYQEALNPNAREKASFLPENFVPLKEKGVLHFIDYQDDDVEWLEGIHVRFLNGHCRAQMIPLIYGKETLVFCADLIPSSWHLPIPYIMAYDMFPLVSMEEKERILEEAITGNWRLHFEHDPMTVSGLVEKNESGKYGLRPG